MCDASSLHGVAWLDDPFPVFNRADQLITPIERSDEVIRVNRDVQTRPQSIGPLVVHVW